MSVFNAGLPNQPDKIAIPATRKIINVFSSGGVSASNIAANVATNLATEALTPAMGTANTLTPVVTLIGSGRVSYLAGYTRNTTPRTIRVVVIVDGVVVFDATTNSISTNSTGVIVAGQASGSFAGPGEPIRYNSYCQVLMASSIVEAAGTTAVAYNNI